MIVTSHNIANNKVDDTLIEIISFLRSNLVINHKLIGIVKRNLSNNNSKLKYWFEPEVAVALSLEEQPVFFYATQPPSTEFVEIVFKKNFKFQANENSLKHLKLELNITKTALLLECYKNCYKIQGIRISSNIDVVITNQEKDLQEIYSMIDDFSKELSLDIKYNQYKDLYNRGTVFIGKVNDIIAGCIFITHPDENICRITYFYIKPDYRGMGLAKVMLSSALEYVFNVLNSKCILYVNNMNTVAKNLYESIGFKVIEEFQTFELLSL